MVAEKEKRMEQATFIEETAHLSNLERLFLVVPFLGGAAFGLAPLLLGGAFGKLFGGSGNDPYAYQLAGAASLGYAVALALAVLQSNWAPVRLVAIAVLVFNLGSLYACAIEISNGKAPFIVYPILVASLVIISITGSLLYHHRSAPQPARDITDWRVWLLRVAVILSTIFGLLPLFLPVQVGHLVGFKATDVFVYRQAGAAALGYAVMSIFALISRSFREIRLPLVMWGVFNALVLIVSLLTIVTGPPSWVIYPLGLAALATTIAVIMALRLGPA
jgi:hypothetical protein